MTTLISYTNLFEIINARVAYPKTINDLRELFNKARSKSIPLTFHAGGHSFDQQSLPFSNGIAISMMNFNHIEISDDERTMTVGSGTTWGDILKQLEPLGLVPYVTVTTAYATAGGTLSADCLSRFSPSFGKEGHHVKCFTFMTLDGELVTCRPPISQDESTWTWPEQVFCGVVGGFGYLGAILDITYELLFVGETNGKIGVSSTIKKHRSFKDLAKDLIPIAKNRGFFYHSPEPALFSALFMKGKKKQWAITIRSKYTNSPLRNRMPQHQPSSLIRLLVEFILRWTLLNRFLWPFFYLLLSKGKKLGDEYRKRYIDDLQGYTFFMDGNRRAKVLGQKLGLKMKSIQQTFFIPIQYPWDEAEEQLVTFLETAHSKMEKADITPTLFDVLFVPGDNRASLSASLASDGFAISFAFESSNKKYLTLVRKMLIDLSDLALKFNGKVSLVKNVFVRDVTLKAMYASVLPRFFALKKKLDPQNLLRNSFLEKLLNE